MKTQHVDEKRRNGRAQQRQKEPAFVRAHFFRPRISEQQGTCIFTHSLSKINQEAVEREGYQIQDRLQRETNKHDCIINK